MIRNPLTQSWFGPVIIAAMALIGFALFDALPERISVHWNLSGEPDTQAGRWPGAFFPVVLAAGVWGLFRILPVIDPRRAHYSRFWDVYWLFANMVVLFVAFVHILILGNALGWPVDVASAIIAAVGLLFLGVGTVLPRLRSNWWTGIRTPWTLSSDTVWAQTHRVAGRTFMGGGAIMIAGVVLSYSLRLWIAGVAFLAAIIIPVIYSYVIWRHEEAH